MVAQLIKKRWLFLGVLFLSSCIRPVMQNPSLGNGVVNQAVGGSSTPKSFIEANRSKNQPQLIQIVSTNYIQDVGRFFLVFLRTLENKPLVWFGQDPNHCEYKKGVGRLNPWLCKEERQVTWEEVGILVGQKVKKKDASNVFKFFSHRWLKQKLEWKVIFTSKEGQTSLSLSLAEDKKRIKELNLSSSNLKMYADFGGISSASIKRLGLEGVPLVEFVSTGENIKNGRIQLLNRYDISLRRVKETYVYYSGLVCRDLSQIAKELNSRGKGKKKSCFQPDRVLQENVILNEETPNIDGQKKLLPTWSFSSRILLGIDSNWKIGYEKLRKDEMKLYVYPPNLILPPKTIKYSMEPLFPKDYVQGLALNEERVAELTAKEEKRLLAMQKGDTLEEEGSIAQKVPFTKVVLGFGTRLFEVFRQYNDEDGTCFNKKPPKAFIYDIALYPIEKNGQTIGILVKTFQGATVKREGNLRYCTVADSLKSPSGEPLRPAYVDWIDEEENKSGINRYEEENANALQRCLELSKRNFVDWITPYNNEKCLIYEQ